MPVNLSIKNVPDDIATRLKERAAKNHRSLQGELMAIVEAAVWPHGVPTMHDLYDQGRRFGMVNPPDPAAVVRSFRGGSHDAE